MTDTTDEKTGNGPEGTVNGPEGTVNDAGSVGSDDAEQLLDDALKEGEDRVEIERLAKLTDIEFARVSKDAAKKLGIGVGDLRKLVAKARSKGGGPKGAKRTMPVHDSNLPEAAYAVRDLLAGVGIFFERGVPVMLVTPADGGLPKGEKLTHHHVVIEVHGHVQPFSVEKGKRITLPERVAELYLSLNGKWKLPPLAGITTAPLLSDDGSIRFANGYDIKTGLWCTKMPNISVPEKPAEEDARGALWKLRVVFHKFPFADAARVFDKSIGGEIVDLNMPVGADESAFLHGLMTSVCRSSLWLAPGLRLGAPNVNGSGTGKGFLGKAICIIAFGYRPSAFTAGEDRKELEKRLVTELIAAWPFMFLDNCNSMALRSNTLASVMTERPSHVRILGVSRSEPLNCSVFVCVTGNALTASEDLVRRFLWSDLDARMEDPEQRKFEAGFLEEIESRRSELLSAALTIWRWGRQNAAKLMRGKPFGGFEQWTEWCRDPLLSLGLPDPVERVSQMKARDPFRQSIGEIFVLWNQHHGSTPTTAADLHLDLKLAIAPPKKGQTPSRQQVASAVQNLAGTRVAGFVLTRQEAVGRWSPVTYQLNPTSQEQEGQGRRSRRDFSAPSDFSTIGHRGHRGRGDFGGSSSTTADPMTPMPMVDNLLGAKKSIYDSAAPDAPNATVSSASMVGPYSDRPRFHKRSLTPVDDQCAECRGGDSRTVWLIADSLNPDREPEALHFACAEAWFDRVSNDAAPAGDVEAAPGSAAASGTCAKCPDGSRTVATYHPVVDEEDSGVLNLKMGDGPNSVQLHKSCSFAWLRTEARRRKLRVGNVIWGA